MVERIVLQEELEGNYVLVEEERPPPDFYGEPVPNEEEDDDTLFELAAGIPRKKKDTVIIKDEPLANEDQFELDYYNADFTMKSHAENKWLIDPDNSEGFALMWSGVRSNYGLVNGKAYIPRVAFQVSIKEFLSTKHLPFDEIDPHDIRVGWSASTSSNTSQNCGKMPGFESLPEML
uniref:Transposase n=1 Tax=Panagrolaimus sp. JU765 TaxID=591449 RepID=A0AC34PXU2_9BILA